MKDNLNESCDIDILARTIYGEARGELSRPEGGLSALIAVANVVMNRTSFPHLFGKTVAEICLKPYQFSCWNISDSNRQALSTTQRQKEHIFDICWQVAEHVYAKKWPDLTGGSDHYHAAWLLKLPAWRNSVEPKIRIGQHIFYKLY